MPLEALKAAAQAVIFGLYLGGKTEELAAAAFRSRGGRVVRYHGVLAPNTGWPARVVVYGAPLVQAPVAANASTNENDDLAAPKAHHWAWANLMRRAFDQRAGLPEMRRAPAPDRYR